MPSIVDKEDELQELLAEAKGIAWDTCHKIYIMMDDQEVAQMRGYGYDPLLTSADTTPEEMVDLVWRWYEDSCSLKFINVTRTGENGLPEFDDLVPQFFEEDEDE